MLQYDYIPFLRARTIRGHTGSDSISGRITRNHGRFILTGSKEHRIPPATPALGL